MLESDCPSHMLLDLKTPDERNYSIKYKHSATKWRSLGRIEASCCLHGNSRESSHKNEIYGVPGSTNSEASTFNKCRADRRKYTKSILETKGGYP